MRKPFKLSLFIIFASSLCQQLVLSMLSSCPKYQERQQNILRRDDQRWLLPSMRMRRLCFLIVVPHKIERRILISRKSQQHALQTLQQRPSSMDSDDEESFISIGNPLPDIEEDEALPKPVKYQEQTVKDAKGRPQRFHGAFTGGFSAGYFNTVATPEGFEPATFVSSRNRKFENVQQQHPEDFMDDEDLGEHGIAPRRIATTNKFESQGEAAKRQLRQVPREGLLSSSVLANLITPASLPMGVKLLRKMGWKEGQGIGPRQMKRKKKKPGQKQEASGSKTYGCALPPSTSDGESEGSSDDDHQGVTFAPKDVTPISFKPKDNVHGIGYSGINPHSTLGQGLGHFSLFDEPDVPTLKAKKKGMRGQAFGVGALNDDDEDIYAQDNLSRYNFEINDQEPQDNNYGWTAPRQHSVKNNSSKVIEGFKVSKGMSFSKKSYPPPKLPKDFKPFHRPKPVIEVTSQERKEKEKHDASSRSEVLGEAPEFRSVFDLVPEAEKKRIDAMKPNIPQRPNRWDRKDPIPPSSTPSSLPTVSVSQSSTPDTQAGQTATSNQKKEENQTTPKESEDNMRKQNVPLFQPATYSATTGFKPFEKLPEKQLRYEAYLDAKKKGVPYTSDVNAALTEWEKDKELEEFSRAAQLYTRINAVMSARFTHGRHGDAIDSTSEKTEDIEIDRSDQDKAAEMKMFGKLTREVVEWHPHRNLCKYFNVPNPYPESTIVGLKNVKRDKFSLYNVLHVPMEPELPSPPPKEPQKALPAPPGKSKPEKKQSIFTEETLAKVNQKISFKIGVDQKGKTEGQETASDQMETKEDGDGATDGAAQEEEVEEEEKAEERPPMDLFSAIFSGSESSSVSSDESEEDTPSEPSKNSATEMSQPATSDKTIVTSAVTSTMNVDSSVDSTEEKTNVEFPKGSVDGSEPLDYEARKDDVKLDSDSKTSAWTDDSEIKADELSADVSFGPSLPPTPFGPTLPPPSSRLPATSTGSPTVSSGAKPSSRDHSVSSSKSRKSKHRSDKDKKSSHRDKKKSKHKKEKKKKSKHKKNSKHKEKKKHRESSSSDESDDSEDSDRNRVDDIDLLSKLKSFAR